MPHRVPHASGYYVLALLSVMGVTVPAAASNACPWRIEVQANDQAMGSRLFPVQGQQIALPVGHAFRLVPDPNTPPHRYVLLKQPGNGFSNLLPVDAWHVLDPNASKGELSLFTSVHPLEWVTAQSVDRQVPQGGTRDSISLSIQPLAKDAVKSLPENGECWVTLVVAPG